MFRMFILALALLCSLSLLTTTPAFAAQSPEDSTGDAQQLKAVVTAVQGLVQVRLSEDQPWQKAVVGQPLPEGAEFRTGPRSAVQFRIEPDQTITLDRLGTIKLLQAVREQGVVKTDVGMKYGRTRYDIATGGETHRAAIHTPSSTLSVKGTRVGVQEGAFGSLAWSTQNVARLTNRGDRRTFEFGAGFEMDDSSEDPGDNAQKQSTVDPNDSNSRDGAETFLAFQRPDGDYDQQRFGLGDANRGQQTGNFDIQRPDIEVEDPHLESYLQFSLLWNTPGQVTDLDLYVRSPVVTDNVISVAPGTVLGDDYSAPSGGFVASVDDLDGSNGGRESIRWENTIPDGNYIVGAHGFSFGGASSVNYQIEVIYKPSGESAQQYLIGEVGTHTLTPGNPTQETTIAIPPVQNVGG